MIDTKNEKDHVARGLIIEALPNTLFKVKIKDQTTNGAKDEEKEILAYLSGKMRFHKIKVLVGDTVDVLLDPYGGRGRIMKRY